ncbi:sugar ABC transporter substrate-binding protein [Robertmurraya siralis]|uniref:Sugar ABC transporter substrate-binding protein n=1 Tax=Robertmurraya siralis TaxID=77777 RepID=A0A919WG91_9BACI|nr:substrate-binding domain-containing protein [Robertmurraya siralis]PAE20143.1 sugar ABC transporter substrate-binding protein [Bacillus sp. 7504-2]GIN61238.1 sugar ABC transporter substrate-binding protein [Robertmurraya siralis]
MRKIGFILLFVLFSFLLYLTFVSSEIVFRSDRQMPKFIEQEKLQHRIVLITQDTETPFWNKVGSGAMDQAQKEGASLEIWGSYGNNREDFLKKLEIAIHSKVDGIIVQGLDSDDFKYLTKVKASFYGIPVITVANDVPVQESLRRTYVGSDQYKAGKMIAEELLKDMGSKGKVLITYNSDKEFYQLQRLEGMKEVLESHREIQLVEAETSSSREEVIAATQDILNKWPDVDAIIAINSDIASALVQEISKRSQVEPYYIYSFDDGQDSISLLQEGKIDGLVEQTPEMMGRKSVQLIKGWLTGETMPLNIDGYFTDIRIVKAMDYDD